MPPGSPEEVELRCMTPADDATVQAAEHLLDGPVRPDWAVSFLQRSGHHLCLAIVGNEAVGSFPGSRSSIRTRAPRCCCTSWASTTGSNAAVSGEPS